MSQLDIKRFWINAWNVYLLQWLLRWDNQIVQNSVCGSITKNIDQVSQAKCIKSFFLYFFIRQEAIDYWQLAVMADFFFWFNTLHFLEKKVFPLQRFGVELFLQFSNRQHLVTGNLTIVENRTWGRPAGCWSCNIKVGHMSQLHITDP